MSFMCLPIFWIYIHFLIKFVSLNLIELETVPAELKVEQKVKNSIQIKIL